MVWCGEIGVGGEVWCGVVKCSKIRNDVVKCGVL